MGHVERVVKILANAQDVVLPPGMGPIEQTGGSAPVGPAAGGEA